MFPVDDKYAGRSRGKVIDNVDPLKRGRIRVEHPLLGETVWIPYLKLPNFYNVPSIGDIVYIEADCGSEHHPVAWGNVIIGPDGNVMVPDAFKRSNPSNRGLYSPGGHLLELDDGSGPLATEKGIRFTTSTGIKIGLNDDDTSVIVECPSGEKVELSTSNGFQVTTSTTNGTSLQLTNGEVNISNPQSSIIMTSSGDITVQNNSSNINCSNDGNIALTGPVGSASIGNDGAINITNGTGSLVITPTGQVELTGNGLNLIELLQEFAQTLSTDVFAGFGAPAGQATKYAEIAAKFLSMKA